jgi:hypothetical protein
LRPAGFQNGYERNAGRRDEREMKIKRYEPEVHFRCYGWLISSLFSHGKKLFGQTKKE